MADEEPKTPVSSSGYYNMSRIYNPTSSNIFYDDLDLNGLGEFTIMFVYNKTFGVARPIKGSYTTGSGGSVSDILTIRSGSIEITFRNSGGGNTTLNHSVTINSSQNYHIAIVGSLIDNTIKLYIDGVSVASNTMNYSIASDYLSFFMERDSGRNYSIGQFNVYDRALTDSEISEHWVYDDVSLFYGVLGWNAMTIGQRADLICSLSCIEDVSYAGNEFSDKSVNNVTLSPNPPLTGDQIYIYTDASDLPSDTTISPVDSLTLLNTTDYVRGTKSTAIDNLTGPQTWSIRVKFDDLVGPKHIMCMNFNAPSARASRLDISPAGDIRFYGFPTVGVNSFTTRTSTASISAGQWYHIVVATDVTTTTKIFINGVKETFGGVGSSLGMDPLLDIAIGKIWTSSGEALGSSNRAQLWNRMLSDAEVAEDYNGSPTEYVCYDKQVADGSTLITGKILDSDLSAGTLIDHTSNSTLSEVGSPTYTDQGMTAECTS